MRLSPDYVASVRATTERLGLMAFVRDFWSTIQAVELSESPHMHLIAKHLEAAALRGTRSLNVDMSRLAWARPTDTCEWIEGPDGSPWLSPGVPGEIKDLAIAVPPGTSKSMLCSVLFPAWLWTWCPAAKLITTSYAEDLVTDFGRQSFDLMTSELYRACWPEWEIEGGERAAMSDYRNSKGGRRWSLPMGGRVTGKHGHFLVSDDPIKPDDLKLGGDSARAALDQVKYRWDALFSNRRAHAETFTRIVIAQRLHVEDLTGHFVRAGAVHLRLPMLFEPHDHYDSVWGSDWRSEPDELLVPGRFPLSIVEEDRKRNTARDFAAQQQQRPSPEDGSLFNREWFGHRWTSLPNGSVVLSVDSSLKDQKGSDFTVIQAWMRDGPKLYLIDQVRARMGFGDQVIAIRAMRAKWAKCTTVLVELKANGNAIVDTLKRTMTGVIGLEPLGGKMARASATEPMWRAGDILLPASNPPWLENFIDEHLLAPVGAHDDCIDAATQAICWFMPKMNRTGLFKLAMSNVRAGKGLTAPRWA